MKSCIILGKPNVGKTAFLLHFAAFVGLNRFEIEFVDSRGERRAQTYSTLSGAVGALVGQEAHKTRQIQRMILHLPVGKGKRSLMLVDTTGISEGIHADPLIREAMAQTLASVRQAGLILHMMDASKVGARGTLEAVGEVDYQVAQFAQMRGGYIILANKMDLPGAGEGLTRIRREFPGHQVLPICAIKREGFQEVYRYVLHSL